MCVFSGAGGVASVLATGVRGLSREVRCLELGSQAEVCSVQLAAGRVSVRVCARARVRVVGPGSGVLLQPVSMTRRSRAAHGEGIKGNVLSYRSSTSLSQGHILSSSNDTLF